MGEGWVVGTGRAAAAVRPGGVRRREATIRSGDDRL
ncbi:hypothetical protein HDA44_004617 [Kribbella solani]|uniref:Uncharacterized protein n=1 Tax=Kribbella solani TaxID=236067 RepID=A0A841DWY1_9ACTN|nr:hypothetical protein [Kribbella solani]